MESHDNVTQWRDCIRAWYPDYKTKTYFVPPVVITRIPFDEVTVAGQCVLVSQCKLDQNSSEQHKSSEVKGQPTQESDTRDDLALQRVLFFLRELVSGQSESMLVISQLKFSGYLGEPLYAAAVKQFLRPHDLSKEYRRGDFDIVIIHRHYGIITGEIKTVLSNQQQFLQTQQVTDVKVAKRVKNAIKQLNKSEVVLHEITKDLEPNLSIRKLLVLPYVSAEVLLRVVSNDEQLQQDLVACLHAADIHEALQYCLLAENISSSGTGMVSDQQQKTWWSTFTAKSGNKMMTSDVYLDLLARHIARYHRFVTNLCTQLPNVCLWAASPYYHQKPEELQEERMTTSLRCPPTVMSEVQKGINRFSEKVHQYTTTTLATPCDGLDVIHLSHKGFAHVGPWPLECPSCGHSIAFTLKRLGLGVTEPRFKHNSNTTGAATTVDSYNNNTNVNRTTA